MDDNYKFAFKLSLAFTGFWVVVLVTGICIRESIVDMCITDMEERIEKLEIKASDYPRNSESAMERASRKDFERRLIKAIESVRKP